MINRTLIRLKIVQILYAYFIRQNNNVDAAEKELLFSLSKAYDLYNNLLLLMVEITNYAESRIEMRRCRLQPTEEDLHPNMRFVENAFIRQLAGNTQLKEYSKNAKFSWKDNEGLVRSLFETVEQSDIYKEYMEMPSTTYDEDRELWRKLYKFVICTYEELDSVLEGISLYWNDDRAVVDTFVLKTIKRFDESKGSEQELLPEFRNEEDRDFALKLLRKTIANVDEYQKLIDEHCLNWDKERIAFMDRVIMTVALTEIVTFPNIPLSVSFDEYVEIAKIYSTPKSASFVNGVLDAVVKELKKENKLVKD
ncbi:MAG: transcription antitermination factor NusB [Bacteroidaceae bacterium]|nr:transcription antitermination factor NusB [Bacteroidaceae bacterium]